MNNNNNEINKMNTNNNNNNNKNLVISNLIIIKILKYLIKELSYTNKEQFKFLNMLRLVCKNWSVFIIPTLEKNKYIFKNNDILYTYLKVRDLLNQLDKKTSTGYKIANNKKISDLLQSLYMPNIASGVYKIEMPTDEEIDEINKKVNIDYRNDYNIYIDEEKCGTIFKPNIEKIKEKSSPSSFGKGTEKVYDESIRKGFHIDASRLKIPFFQYNNKNDSFSSGVERIKNQFLADNNNFTLQLYKLHIYEKDGQFKEHHDSMQSIGHIGTYIVPLGINTYTGGEFVISEHDSFDETTQTHRIEATPCYDLNIEKDIDQITKIFKNNIVYPHNQDPNIEQNNQNTLENKENREIIDFKWIGFYNDCIHKVEKVTSGTRLVLQFNILNNQSVARLPDIYIEQTKLRILEGSQIYYSPKYQYLTYNQNARRTFSQNLNPPSDKSIYEHIESNSKIMDKLSIELSTIMKDSKLDCGIFLNHLYKANIDESNLKGLDIMLFEKLLHSFGRDRVKIQTFIITRLKGDEYSDDDDFDDDDDDDQDIAVNDNSYDINIDYKISLLSIGTLNSIKNNQRYSYLNKNENTHTLMFCGLKHSNLKSIYTVVRGMAGNEEVTRQDYGSFSAIIISSN